MLLHLEGEYRRSSVVDGWMDRRMVLWWMDGCMKERKKEKKSWRNLPLIYPLVPPEDSHKCGMNVHAHVTDFW